MSYPKFCEYCYSPENTGTILKYYFVEGKIKLLCESCALKYYRTKEVNYENNRWWQYVDDFNE